MELAALALLLGIPRKRRPLTGTEALAHIREMAHELRIGIYQTRQAARNAGLVSLGNELTVHGLEIKDIGLGLAGRIKDAQRAELYSRRYAELWRAKFNRHSLAFDAKKAAQLASKETDFRLKSIAITEANRALNEQKREVAIEVQSQTRVKLYEVWDAMRDACPACAERDGEMTPVGDSFSGDQPGDMHPNCQCESHYITK